jgi:RNA polymerase sigma factor (sigma-70 family)
MYLHARTLTQDHHLAEDVLQEALIQAFLHVGRLVEESRFAPWLARIVRNQAYMKLRRGGPYAKEKPISCISDSGRTGRSTRLDTLSGTVNEWRDIDRVLFHLSRNTDYAPKQMQDPEAALLRKELIEGIRVLFACLSAREKDIFEAHFFHYVTPFEIARALDTSVANVYNSISRAKVKLQRERLRLFISLYVKERHNDGKPKAKLLDPPILYHPREC